jgi:drug/metabolite transporter (DMT)-like permease
MIDLPSKGGLADWAGMVASIGCAIHCAAMPLVLAYLPSLGLGWLAEEGFHRWMAVVCFALAAAAFVPGWRKHKSFLPAVWGGIGILMLTTAAFGFEGSCCASCDSGNAVAASHADCEFCLASESGEATTTSVSSVGTSLLPFVTPLGGVFLVIGHIVNHRKSCVCQGNSCCLSEDGDSVES